MLLFKVSAYKSTYWKFLQLNRFGMYNINQKYLLNVRKIKTQFQSHQFISEKYIYKFSAPPNKFDRINIPTYLATHEILSAISDHGQSSYKKQQPEDRWRTKGKSQSHRDQSQITPIDVATGSSHVRCDGVGRHSLFTRCMFSGHSSTPVENGIKIVVFNIHRKPHLFAILTVPRTELWEILMITHKLVPVLL